MQVLGINLNKGKSTSIKSTAKKSTDKKREAKKRVAKKTLCEKCKNCKCNKESKVVKKKIKRKPSAYNKHISSEMKKGKSMKEASKSWKAKKN